MWARPNFSPSPKKLDTRRAVSLMDQPFRSIAVLRRSAKSAFCAAFAATIAACSEWTFGSSISRVLVTVEKYSLSMSVVLHAFPCHDNGQRRLFPSISLCMVKSVYKEPCSWQAVLIDVTRGD